NFIRSLPKMLHHADRRDRDRHHRDCYNYKADLKEYGHGFAPVCDGYSCCAEERSFPVLSGSEEQHQGQAEKGGSLQPREEIAELMGIDGLREVLLEPRGERPLSVGGSGERHENGLVLLRPKTHGELVAVHAGQTDVEQHQIRTMLAEEIERAAGVGGDPDTMIPTLEEGGDSLRGVLLVFHDQDGFLGHVNLARVSVLSPRGARAGGAWESRTTRCRRRAR